MRTGIRILAWAFSSIAGAVVLAYLVALWVNREDQAPSEAALALARLIDDRPAVPDDENAAIYALGFDVRADSDPMQAGSSRRDWIEAVNKDPSAYQRGPSHESGDFGEIAVPGAHRLRMDCGGDSNSGCRESFDELSAMPPTESERVLLQRYRTMLAKPRWREVIPMDLRLPITAFSTVLNGQRLYLLDLRRRAGSGAAEEIRAALHADQEFWRGVQESSDILITKMIAVAALRQHYFLGNLVVRALPPGEQLAAVPEGWKREYSPQELDMRRVMAGELRFAEGILRELLTATQLARNLEFDSTPRSWGTRLVEGLGRPLYQPQDQVNRMAGEYMAQADRFQIPLAKYLEADEKTRDDDSTASAEPWRIYNPIGQWLRRQSGGWTYGGYAIRVGVLEGMRRAVMMTTLLRSRAVVPERMPEEIRASNLRDPFSDKAFDWSETESAVVYSSPDKAAVTRHVYFY